MESMMEPLPTRSRFIYRLGERTLQTYVKKSRGKTSKKLGQDVGIISYNWEKTPLKEISDGILHNLEQIVVIWKIYRGWILGKEEKFAIRINPFKLLFSRKSIEAYKI